MRRFGLLPITDRRNETASHEPLPHAIDHHLSKTLVLRRGDEGGEAVARVLGIFGEERGGLLLCEFGERPSRLHFGAGFQGHLDERGPARLVKAVHRHAARFGQLDHFLLHHRRELEEILLLRGMGGRIMAAGALHLDAEESRAHDHPLRCHRHIVLRSGRESGRTSEALAPLHAEQLRHKEIGRFVVEERLVQPPAEGTRVV